MVNLSYIKYANRELQELLEYRMEVDDGQCSIDVDIDDILRIVTHTLEPDDVYDIKTLEQWALNNGFTRDTE